MKFVIISDIHGDKEGLIELTKALKKRIHEETCLLIAGDLGLRSEDIEEELSELCDTFVNIYYVPGNDDPPNLSIKGFQNIDRNFVVINEVAIIGLGGSPPIGVRTLYNWMDEDRNLYRALSKCFESAYRYHPLFTIFLTHCPPRGILDEATFYGRRHIGSQLILNLARAYTPTIHFFGHVHREGGRVASRKFRGREVKFVNVAIFSHKTPYKALSKRYFVLKFQDGIKMDMDFVVNPYLDINAFIMEYV